MLPRMTLTIVLYPNDGSDTLSISLDTGISPVLNGITNLWELITVHRTTIMGTQGIPPLSEVVGQLALGTFIQ